MFLCVHGTHAGDPMGVRSSDDHFKLIHNDGISTHNWIMIELHHVCVLLLALLSRSAVAVM